MPFASAIDVACTTFPIYNITRNITEGREGVSVELMLPASLGCPHDYALTPQDMLTLARADVLVVNGHGMEEFLGAPVEKANPSIRIIDSSEGITNLIEYSGSGDAYEWAGVFELEAGTYPWTFAKVNGSYADPGMGFVLLPSADRGGDAITRLKDKASDLLTNENGQTLTDGSALIPGDQLHSLLFNENQDVTTFLVTIDQAGTYVAFTEHMPFEFEAGEHFLKNQAGVDIEPVAQFPHVEEEHAHHGEHQHHHHHSGVNPHLFASPRMAALIAQSIATSLSAQDPEGADVYAANASAYVDRMNQLADEMEALGKTLANNRIVQPHGIFDYLARDIGLEIVAVTQPHGQEPSAAEMLRTVQIIRERDAGAVFTEPQYSPKVGQTIAAEAGVPVAILDPAASGPENAPLDYFESVMRSNINILRTTLGVHD
jgi:ABC-type Zn uptake system ZnuABC Zn-binding protein ZnuA